jgi:hypothetical protein
MAYQAAASRKSLRTHLIILYASQTACKTKQSKKNETSRVTSHGYKKGPCAILHTPPFCKPCALCRAVGFRPIPVCDVSAVMPVSGASRPVGNLIRLKRIYNFWCSMLVLTPFALSFVTLRGVFMHFPELTYWQDATVPVPYFRLFLCFRKATQEIFLELDKIKAETHILPGGRTRTKREQERGQRAPSPWGGAA